MSTRKATMEEVLKKIGASEGTSFGQFFLTPAMAKWILNHCNYENRRLNKAHVEELRHDMESGNWHADIDHIGFDSNGKLINGQHRLKALATSSIDGVRMNIDFGVEEHVGMDTGRKRKWTDQVYMAKKAGESIISDLHRKMLIAGFSVSNPDRAVTNHDIQLISAKISKDLEHADEISLFDLGKVNSAATHAALFWALKSGVSLEDLAHVAKTLRTGIAKEDWDIPLIRLRDELILIKGNGKSITQRRFAYTQQAIFDHLRGSTSNRLPSRPICHYMDFGLDS